MRYFHRTAISRRVITVPHEFYGINGNCGVALNINNGTFLNSLKGAYTRWLTSYCCDTKDLHLKKWVF